MHQGINHIDFALNTSMTTTVAERRDGGEKENLLHNPFENISLVQWKLSLRVGAEKSGAIIKYGLDVCIVFGFLIKNVS